MLLLCYVDDGVGERGRPLRCDDGGPLPVVAPLVDEAQVGVHRDAHAPVDAGGARAEGAAGVLRADHRAQGEGADLGEHGVKRWTLPRCLTLGASLLQPAIPFAVRFVNGEALFGLRRAVSCLIPNDPSPRRP